MVILLFLVIGSVQIKKRHNSITKNHKDEDKSIKLNFESPKVNG